MKDFLSSPKQKKLLISVITITFITLIYLAIIHINTTNLFLVKVGAIETGYVSQPAVVEKWIAKENQKLKDTYPQANVKLDTKQLSFEPVQMFRGKTTHQATIRTLQSILQAKAYGVELVINGKEIGIVKDRKTAEHLIKFYKNRQISQIEKQQTNPVKALSADSKQEAVNQAKSEIQSIQFVEPYEFRSVDAKPEDIVDPRKLLDVIEVGNVGEHLYTVQEGDCISCIAQKFNIPPSMIYNNNPWIESDRITVGDTLNLTVKKPLLSVRTIEKIVEREEIHHSTTYQKDPNLRAGAVKEVTQGKDGLREITLLVTKIGGEIVEEQTLQELVLREPVQAVIKRGTKIIPGEGTGAFSTPVKGGMISSRYGMRGGRMHQGIDFTSGNRNIYAADTGRIIFVGYQNGYGNTIVIDHRNGYQTKYAHLSSFNARSGENVEKGDAIGIMGNTGNSDGIHLHFEIHKHGVVVNPSKHIYR